MKQNIIEIIQIIIVFAIGILLIVPVFLLVNYFYGKEEKQYTSDSTWVSSYGVVISTLDGPKFEYHYNGSVYKKYGFYDLELIGACMGDIYTIKINPKKPDKFVAIDWQPIFLSGEETEIGRCKITRIVGEKPTLKLENSPLAYCSVEFVYTVNGEEYEREQALPPKFTHMFGEIKPGQLYEVEYLVENPQRSIIHLDKPIK